MYKNRIRGPVITLAAVGALGGGLWLANVSQEVESAAGPAPAVATVDHAPNPPAPSIQSAPVQFPAAAAYSGVIETRTGPITVDITVHSGTAVAYVCDGHSLERWLRGDATDGALTLADPAADARLEGSLQAGAVSGRLWIGERTWDFTAPAAASKAPAEAQVAGDDDY